MAVAIRRGPSKTVCTVLWDRRDDSFKVGQWLRGRIYERRSDLSPDGKHLIYFAMNGRWSSETGGSWTAVSNAPFLKAVTLYAKGDCWNGGGLFTSKRSYWLNQTADQTLLNESKLIRDDKFQPKPYGNECTGVYYVRLERDGWTLKEQSRRDLLHGVAVFDKAIGKGWVLRKYAHEQVYSPAGKGCYWDEHELVQESRGIQRQFPDWEWAEAEGNQVMWVSEGKLWKAYLKAEGLSDEKCLFDFNPMKFEAIQAPY
jgi:hypothetical protein